MLMLLSPAKSMEEGPPVPWLPVTEPVMLDQTAALHEVLRHKSASDLSELMGISDKLGQLNHRRYQEMRFAQPVETSRQAVWLFRGDVYRGLDAQSLDAEDLSFAQGSLGILSGLYGLLAPLDRIQPYRLEMGTRLETERGSSLYDFWGSRITDRIAERVADEGHDAVVNLASKEYFSSVQPERLPVPWIIPVFQDVKDGKPRVLAFFAKRARGAMVRWAIRRRLREAEGLQECDAMGYRFVPEASSETRWVFRRPQPPPAGR